MAYDVFISYSHCNKAVADAICARLEQEGVRCWYAPRDIRPGEIWMESIINAIRTVKVMIVVFTEEANKSPQVLKEITNAVSAGVTIVPFKLTSEEPSTSLQYLFADVHWLDAVGTPLNKSVETLSEKVCAIVKQESAPPATPPAPPAGPHKPQKRSKLPLILAAGALIITLLVCGGLLLSGKLGGGKRTATAEPQADAAPLDTAAPTQALTTEAPVVFSTQAPTAEPTSAPLETPAPTATATPALTATPAPTAVPTINPNNQSYFFTPKGVAYIFDGKDTFIAPISSLYTIYYAEIVHGMKFLRVTGSDLPAFDKIASIEMTPFEEGHEYHRGFRVTLMDGSVIETDVQTAWSDLHFLAGGVHVSREWYMLESIRFDHEGSCLVDWPEYARLTLRDGSVIVVPAFTLNVATHRRPSENTINYDHVYEWPSTIKTERGYQIDFSEIRSLVFREGSFYKDKLSDIWVEGIKPGWITELPVAILFRDGRTLNTGIAEDFLKLFAIDEFGKVEVRADQIGRIDFVADITEEVDAPALP